MASAEFDDDLSPDASAALAVAGALFAEDTVTPTADGRQRFLERLEADAEFEKHALEAHDEADAALEDTAELAPAPNVGVRLNCTYCHDALQVSVGVHCGACLAPHHAECFGAHGACAAPGCAGTHVVRATPATRPRRWRGALFVGAAFGVAAAAALIPDWGNSATAPQAASADGAGDEQEPQTSVPVDRRAATAEGPQRVLYVEGYPRWQYRYLKNILLGEPGIECQTILLSSPEPGEASEGLPLLASVPTNLEEYDVVILGDVPTTGVGAAWRSALVAEVRRDGLGVILAAGSKHPRDLANSELGALFPVEFAEAPATQGEWNLRLTEAGSHASALRFRSTFSANRSLWDTLPGVFWHAGATAPKPGAEVWAQAASIDGGKRVPVLAWAPIQQGRVAWLGFEGAWRWRAEVGDEYLARFFLSLLTHVRRPPGPQTPSRAPTNTADRAQALYLEALTAFDEGRADRALELLHEISARYAEFLVDDSTLQQDLTDTLLLIKDVRARIETAQALGPNDSAVLLFREVAELLSERRYNAYYLEAEEQLASIRVERAKQLKAEAERMRLPHAQEIRKLQGLLADGLSVLDQSLVATPEGAQLAEVALTQFTRVIQHPEHTAEQILEIHTAVADAEERFHFLDEARRCHELDLTARYPDLSPRLELLMTWLPEGSVRAQARELFSAISPLAQETGPNRQRSVPKGRKSPYEK